MKQYFKLALPNGFDFHTGKTINYREAIGKTVSVKKEYAKQAAELCSPTVIHASEKINDCFVGAKIPCSAYIVTGKPVVSDEKKCGFRTLKVLEEIPRSDFNEVFGFNILETENPINPLKLNAPQVGEEQIRLLRAWALVWASVGALVWASVGASVEASVEASVGDSVGALVWALVGASVGASVWASVRDSVYAYIGSLFPKIEKWRFLGKQVEAYPFQPAVRLWQVGLVPSYDGKVWRLHAGEKAKIVYELKKEEK